MATGSAAVTNAQDPDQIQRDIERTRAELGDTVEALAEKADVKAFGFLAGRITKD